MLYVKYKSFIRVYSMHLCFLSSLSWLLLCKKESMHLLSVQGGRVFTRVLDKMIFTHKKGTETFPF